MNKWLILILLSVITITNTSLRERIKIKIETNSNILNTHPIPDKPLVKLKRKSYDLFITELAKMETGNLPEPYKIVNRYGYMGKYQFSKKTLRQLVKQGYLDITKDELNNFLNLPYVQEKAIRALIAHNTQILKNYKLHKYVGKKIKGVTITMEGMLAGAHLVGPYAVKHFITTGGSLETIYVKGIKVSKFDGNGTSILKYIKKFEHA